MHVNISTMESGGNIPAGANLPWFFQIPEEAPADEEPFDDNSESSDSDYDPHDNHPYNCDLSAPGSDAGSDFDEDASDNDYLDDYIPEEADPDLYEHLYKREPKERDRLVECNSNHLDRRKRCQDKGMEWVPMTIGYLTAWFGILILIAAQGVGFWKLLGWKTLA